MANYFSNLFSSVKNESKKKDKEKKYTYTTNKNKDEEEEEEEKQSSSLTAEKKEQDLQTPAQTTVPETKAETKAETKITNATDWNGEGLPSYSQVLGQLTSVYEQDNAKGIQLANQFSTYLSDPGSPYYRPYNQATNPAVENLKEYGVDSSTLTDDWFNQNMSWITENLIYGENSNTPSKPGKKASSEQKLAYQLYQYYTNEEKTKKAESEYAEALNEARYWAWRSELNLSDDEILNKVRTDFNKKYPTLAEMEESSPMNLVKLNRGVDFSDDALRGAIYTGRNTDFKGTVEQAIAASALGRGNLYEYNEEISNKLNPESADFDGGYSLGCTNLDDAAYYFRVNKFDKQWIEEHQNLAYSNDPEEKKMYDKVRAAYENQVKAEDELNNLIEFVQTKSRWFHNADDIMDQIDWSKYPTLAAMDKSIGQNGNLATGNLVALTEGLNYRYDDIKTYAESLCKETSGKRSSFEYYKSVDSLINEYNTKKAKQQAYNEENSVSHPLYRPTEAEIEVAREKDKKLEESASMTWDIDTPSEQAVSKNQLSCTYDMSVDWVKNLKSRGEEVIQGLANATMKANVGKYSKAILGGFDTVADYEQRDERIKKLDATEAELGEKLGDLVYAGKDYKNDETVRIEINGREYDLKLNWESHEEYNQETGEMDMVGEYMPSGVFEVGTQDAPQGDYTNEQYQEAVKKALDEENEGRAKHDAYKGTELTEEQQQDIRNYWNAKDNAQVERDLQSEKQDEYDKAKKEITDTQTTQDNMIRMMKESGIDTKPAEDAAVVTDFFLNFTKYDPTEWKQYNFYHSYSQAFMNGSMDKDKMFQVAKTGDDEIQQAIDVAETMIEYADEKGISLPDSVRENVQRYIESLQRQHEDFEYLSEMNNEDFSEKAADGRTLSAQEGFDFDWTLWGENASLEAQPGWEMLSKDQQETLKNLNGGDVENAGFGGYEIGYIASTFDLYIEQMDLDARQFGIYNMSELMTDYEKETYYYLLETQGRDAAETYYNHLTDKSYGVMNSRAAEKTRETADTISGSGNFLQTAGAEVLNILLAPVSAIGSFIYTADVGLSKLRGERVEFNPDNLMLTANIYRKESRAKITEEINNYYKDNEVLRTLVGGLYEIISNRGDSIANAAVFGPIFGGLSSGMLSEFMGALPMAITAATDAVAEAKENGVADDINLLGIFASTLIAEAGTEAISLENIKDAMDIGQDIANGGLKEFFENWLKEGGISEMLGETFTEVWEQAWDRELAGENSEYNQLYNQFLEKTGNEKEAQALASQELMGRVLHTALISYLTPGADIVSYATGRYSAYRNEAMNRQQADDNVSVLDVYKEYKKDREKERISGPIREDIAEIEKNNSYRNEEEASRAADYIASRENKAPETTETEPVFDAEAEMRKRNAQDITLDYEILETALDADASTMTASIAAVMDMENTPESKDAANAAAANMDKLFDRDITPAEGLQNLLIGAHTNDVSPILVKQAVEIAALSENSTAFQTMQSEEYQNADPGERAEMLAATVEQDRGNGSVMKEVTDAIRNNRIAKAEKLAVDAPEVKTVQDAAYKAQGDLLAAQAATRQAQEESDNREAELQAARDNLLAAGGDQVNNAADPTKVDAVTHAISQLQKIGEVAAEYRQHLAKAQATEKKTQELVDRKLEEYANAKRTFAERLVNEEDQQRAQAKQEQAIAAEEMAKQAEKQRVQQEATDNANVADVEGFLNIVRQGNKTLTAEDEQTIRQKFAEAQSKRNQQTAVEDERGADGKLTDRAKEARNKAVGFINSKFGLPVVFADNITKEDKNKTYSEGFYDPENHRIVANNDLSFDEIMTRVLPHELLHSLEKAGSYNSVANSLLSIYYGKDSNFDQAVKNLEKNNGVPTSRLESDILHYKSKYDKGLKKQHSYLYAAQELAAHRMGEMFYNPDNPQRSQEMIERLAAEKPSAAKQIMNTLKSMVKKTFGMKGAWLSNTQKTIDLFEKALSKGQTEKQSDGNKYAPENKQRY